MKPENVCVFLFDVNGSEAGSGLDHGLEQLRRCELFAHVEEELNAAQLFMSSPAVIHRLLRSHQHMTQAF